MSDLSGRDWTNFQIDSEIDFFGTGRIVREHNELRRKYRKRVAYCSYLQFCIEQSCDSVSYEEWEKTLGKAVA